MGQCGASEAVSADRLDVGDWIKRGAGFWQIERILERPKIRMLQLGRGMNASWWTHVRRTTIVYRKAR